MSNNAEENSNKNNHEQQFFQLLSEFETRELILKTTEDNLNNSLKRNSLLQQELETEQHSKSIMKMKLDTLSAMVNNRSNPEFKLNVSIKERDYLTKKKCIIEVENMELKQLLTNLNGQISSLLADKYQKKTNTMTLLLNFLQEQVKVLENELHTLVNILCAGKMLSKKILCGLKYSKNKNKIQSDHIQHLIKEVANIKSKLHAIINENDTRLAMKDDQKNITDQTNLEICEKLVKDLELENNTLHKTINKMIKKHTVKNDVIECDDAIENDDAI